MNTSRKWTSFLAVSTFGALLTLAANGAGAADTERPAAMSKTVKVWDLDLAKDAHVQALYARVRDAAVDVCRAEARRYRNGTRRPAPLGFSDQCVADAVDAAVREVGNRRLAAVHSGDARAMR
jgi:UrcA family protein